MPACRQPTCCAKMLLRSAPEAPSAGGASRAAAETSRKLLPGCGEISFYTGLVREQEAKNASNPILYHALHMRYQLHVLQRVDVNRHGLGADLLE